MSPNPEYSFEAPSRQSPIGVIIILMKFFRVAIRQIFPLLVLYVIKPGGGKGGWIKLGLMGFGVFYVIRSIMVYLRFYFYIEKDELIIEKGIFKRVKISIPLDRIQSVNFEQNLVHRIFDVVHVKADTAGSAGDEAEIPALSMAKGEALRRHILEYKAAHKKATSTPTLEGEIEPEEVEAIPDHLLFSRSLSDLIKVGLGVNHLRTMGLILAFLTSFSRQISEWLNIGQEEVEGFLLDSIGIGLDTIVSTLLVMVPALVIIGVVVSIVFSLVRTVVRYYDLKIFQTEQGFKVKSGLFTRQEQAAVLQKIQIVKWNANPLMIGLKILTIQLFQASSSKASAKRAVSLPGSNETNLDQILDIAFPGGIRSDLTWHGISKTVINRRILYMGVVPALAATAFAWFHIESQAFLLLLWIPFMVWTSIRYQRRWRYGINKDVIQTRSGIFGHKNTLLQLFKIMSMNITQSPYQRRKGVATLQLFTAAGNLEIPYIELEKAQKLQNYILYRVESDARGWM